MLTIKEKVGYGLGDTGSNIVFQVVLSFMVYFYTDVYGLSAATVGTLMLAVRLFDAVTDPLMGGIADRTRTRFGRYRPYLLIISIPYGVLAVMTFTTPELGEQGKVVYAYVTYAALMTVYTAINIPYSALGGVITDDPQERASVQSYRFAMAMAGGALVSAATMPLVQMLGQGDAARGFQLALGFLATVAVLCFWGCFFLTRERVEPEQKPSSVSGDLRSLLSNDQFLWVALITFAMLVLVAMRSAVAPYYVEYYLGRPELITAFITTGMASALAGALFTNLVVRKLCKLRLLRWANVGLILFHLALFFVPQDGLYLAFVLFGAANFCQMIIVPLMFSMVADTADYGAKKSGKKIMAMSYSAHLLVIKLGLAVGGALTGWLLGYYGYVANTAQSDHALTGILVIFALSSALCGVVIALVLPRYRLNREALARIHQDDQDSSKTAMAS
ncbi:glycoside-pentoside-hexuronide (GPH):cation symporter [Ferrimonas marina]|uniref:Glycoside/pentoside/hexuronide:cation symporter, GPH family n=1 Tax=Ferrimonas marina TaxID=299255 RepID=A0A1M5NDX0_9GAMM|nr:glycoside-pentoside-hexuronide (GPH):cation symporter [Ferrimonas marina]SHG87657.1 glycoside/pentoside/hexuronide:cation symporter, GPH family [Ferrimonas marina]